MKILILLKNYFLKYDNLFFTLLILILVSHAHSNRFIQDDAYISYRYAENFANGIGLVFNQGEHVEGYTNFLWTVIISLGILFGATPESFSIFVGLFFLLITLYIYKYISKFSIGDRLIELCFLGALGFTYSFSAYATGGLETSLLTLLVSISILLAAKILKDPNNSLKWFPMLGLIFASMILTRPDSALICSVVSLFLIFYTGLNHERRHVLFSVYGFLLLTLAFFVIIGPWLIWKINFYGTIFPNTAKAKIVGINPYVLFMGGEYLNNFIKIYWLGPLLVYGTIIYFAKLRSFSPAGHLGILIFFIQSFYIVLIGGDFMEFRFFIPFIPPLILFLFESASLAEHKKVFSSVIALSIISASFIFRNADRNGRIERFPTGIETVHRLKTNLTRPETDWITVGKMLNRSFPDRNIKIASMPAGAIPYFSKLYSIDMLGLNDSNVDNREYFGVNPWGKPGHRFFAKFGYLRKQGINLVIGNGAIRFTSLPIESDLRFFLPFISDEEITSVDRSRIVKIPIDGDRSLIALYLNDSPLIDAYIKEGKWILNR
ncbi:hypothetical protein [Leptospira dzoumogneensis]|uniref:Glycosyltransferase RgtA/B/C/D-like domain-containing protein n=1 Tax=Leptospira dzoumogneensis TaxID=2484904 RepID=A0A4Z1AIG9_9LEPT|nr:hypothetical protein [Leptospira dzoumogneensis]TGN03301.1 hypothetical protein EHR06_04650 [Leptospira dzoumogneensis]